MRWHKCSTRSAGRKFTLRSELHDIKRGKYEGVQNFVARTEKVRMELKEACDENVPDDVMVHAVLSGLGKVYDAFVRQIKYGAGNLS